jgi:hypothetical protein
MRRNLLKPLLACLLLFGGMTAAMAQTTTPLPFSQEWSYLVTNALPPGGWTNINYPAAAGWPTGAAPLASAGEAMPGGVPPLATTLDLNYNGNFVTSYYFRTTFNLPSNPSNLVFTVNAAIDDGAVFYVNGRRVQNLRMTTGAVTHNTFATGDGGGDVSARALDTFTIASTNFVQGDNVIAVSLHQVNGTSTDVAFAMEIDASAISPPVIVSQPQSQTVQVGRRAVFDVGATGTALVYRWFADGVLVASTPTYTTPFATLNMDGTVYHVIVSNVLGRVQSSPAILRVVPDTFGPIPTNAIPSTARSNWIDLRFDEVLMPGFATNPLNFAVISLGGTCTNLTITNVVTISSAAVSIRLNEVPDRNCNFVVCAYNQQDTNGFTTPSYCIGLAFQSTNVVFASGDSWRWNENQWLAGNTDPTNGPGGISWTHINYPDNPASNFLWTEGDAPLREDFQFNGTMCATNNGNNLSRTPITTYMKKRFTVSTNYPAGANLLLRFQIDDGAVFYLNGNEIHRVNMPTGTPNYSTFASSSVDGTCTSVVLAGRGTNLIRGQNVMAVEVHQFNESTTAGHDTYFDMELSVTYPITAIIPDLRVTLLTNTAPAIRLNWSTNAPGWVLETATTITGAWSTVTGVTGGAGGPSYQIPISQGGPQRFYRMRNEEVTP